MNTILNTLTQKRIVLGITGGIAAYKSAELTRLLVKAGAEVRVIMTRAAQEFIGALTLQALSGQAVHSDLFDPAQEAAMGHIALARFADALLIAPATAECLAKLAQGRGEDLLTTTTLATRAPLLLAPAMNQQMWASHAVQQNLATLRARGALVIGPADGEQACGDVGMGRMSEPEEILAALNKHFAQDSLAGVRVLITAGATREAIDPVRFLSNRSSGKMGYALAQAAREAGAAVTVISGVTALPAPAGVHVITVESARQMHAAVMHAVPQADIFIAAAAVADYRAAETAPQKMKKSGADGLTLKLVQNPDILQAVAARAGGSRPYVVGFAAETENLAANAQTKLRAKKLDMIAANDVSQQQGFEQDDNALMVFWHNGELSLPRASKTQLARQLIQLIAKKYSPTHS